jgi:hypothetical protein
MLSPRLLAFIARMSPADFERLVAEAGDVDFYQFVVARALNKSMSDVTSEERIFVKRALFFFMYQSTQAFLAWARCNDKAERVTTLHLKETSSWNIGPDIRKCTECGTRLWLSSDGVWTDDRRVWLAPPIGYVGCAKKGEQT